MDNHTNTSPLSFYRSDALPVAQPIVSKYCIENYIAVFLIWENILLYYGAVME